jgi:hypothetical protein
MAVNFLDDIYAAALIGCCVADRGVVSQMVDMAAIRLMVSISTFMPEILR